MEDINKPRSFIRAVEECSRKILMNHVVEFELFENVQGRYQ